MAKNYHPPFGRGNKNRLLSADDVRIILNSNRLYHEENIPGVDFRPETPTIYGKACAYDMAFRLINYPRGRAPGFVTVHRYRRPDTASRL